MKKFVTFASLSLAFWVAQAFAAETQPSRRPLPLLRSEIVRFEIDRKIPWAGDVTSGNVTVDKARRKVTLVLDRKFHCPMGRYCAMVMPAPIFVEVPLVSVQRDRCGSVVYTAVEDRRSQQGGMSLITLSDNTGNRCPSLRMRADTEIVYETESASYGTRPVLTRSSFDGARLEKIQ